MESGRRGSLGLALLLFAWLLLDASAARAQPCAAQAEISIGAGGYTPEMICLVSGGVVHWTNDSGAAATILEPTGRFDSAPLAPGAGFSVTLSQPGSYRYGSPLAPGLQGHIVVAVPAIDAPPDEPVSQHIPDIAFPLPFEDDLSPHPIWVNRTSRTRLLLSFSDETTVAQANAALAAAGVLVAGGLPRVGTLLVLAEDTPDFSGLEAAQALLKSDPNVEFATQSSEVGLDTLPRPVDSVTVDALNTPPAANPPIPPTTWEWTIERTPDDGPWGKNGNWNLEASRVPQAWNWREAIERKGQVDSVRTALIDTGAFFHEDFDEGRIDRTPACKADLSGIRCTLLSGGDHGTLLTSIVMADHDNDGGEGGTSRGVSGVNPLARLLPIKWQYTSTPVTWSLIYEIIDLVTQIANVRVINLSMGIPYTQGAFKDWWKNQGTAPICGPGEDDDGEAGSNEICTFNNDDDWLERVEDYGKSARNISEHAAAKGIVISKSAGNSSTLLCKDQMPHPCGADGSFQIAAVTSSGFNWASYHWNHPVLPDPIVVVEAIDEDLERTGYSDDGGHISAPGNRFARAVNPNDYYLILGGGTSSAAPHVAGVLGQMLAFDPSQTIPDVRSRLESWKRADVTNPRTGMKDATGRLDAFASMLAIPGAAKALVDVNDLSADGNRRVIRGPPTASDPAGIEFGPDLHSSDEVDPTTGTFYQTAPDGIIDMRDFRRFRDARTLLCIEQGLDACSDVGVAFLDGDADHPKKDINFDRCVHAAGAHPECPEEINYPRFDFNGDGLVSAVSSWPVPLQPDGTPASTSGEATSMTDLEVMMSQWHPDPAMTEGYTAADLPGLMNSADLAIFADQFFDQGATDMSVHVVDASSGNPMPVREIASGESIVYTVPVGPPLKVVATAQIAGEMVTTETPTFQALAAGDDQLVELCRRRLLVTASPPIVEADGSAEAVVTATLDGCTADVVGNVTFGLTPEGDSHGALELGSVPADSEGRAGNRFFAGTEIAEYVVIAVASVEVAAGEFVEVEGQVTIRTAEPTRVFYRWRQDVLDFQETGSSRWTGIPEAPGDCDGLVREIFSDGSVVEYSDGAVLSGEQGPGSIFANREGWPKCVDHFQLHVSENAQLEREGVLRRTADGVRVTERAGGAQVEGSFEFTTHQSTGPANVEPFDDLSGDWETHVAAADLQQYEDEPLPPTTQILSDPEGLRVEGLSAVGDLAYSYESVWVQDGIVTFEPLALPQVHRNTCFGCIIDGLGVLKPATMQSELLLVPREDRSAIRYRGDDVDELVFAKDAAGNYLPYSYCEVIESSYETPPEYYSAGELIQDGVYTKGLWKRNSDFADIDAPTDGSAPGPSYLHEYPMPRGAAQSTMRYAFVAIPYQDESELDDLKASGALDIPSCEEGAELLVDFGWIPDPAGEGEVVFFTDLTQSDGNSLVSWDWDFGDGETSSEQHPSHRYRDDGEYSVRLEVVDATGAAGEILRTVTVENRPPRVQIDEAVATEGSSAQLVVRLADPGEIDAQLLAVEISSTAPGFPTISQGHPAGIQSFQIAGLPSGSFTVDVTVTDKDGASDTASAPLTILGPGDPPPPPPPAPAPVPTCDPTVVLDGQEASFLDALNDHRAQAGLNPVAGSPALTLAADRHSKDMAEGGFLDHVGSDASTPGQRAQEAGYPTVAVDENLLAGLANGEDVLFAWMASPVHNANLLEPNWEGVGIARREGVSGWYWTVDFGAFLDCGNASVAPEPRALLARASPASGATPEVGDDVWVLSYRAGVSTPTSVMGMVQLAGAGGLNVIRHLEESYDEAERVGAAGFGPTPEYGPLTALVVGAASIEQGMPLAVRNRSRDADGVAIAATLEFGDGAVEILAPNQGVGHSYALPGGYELVLTSTDGMGITTRVSRSVEVLPAGPPTGSEDFNLLLSPSSHVMAPGSQIDFVVTLAAIDGFDAPVTLSVGPLPMGVTASFSHDVVVPSGSTLLSIVASDDAEVGDFEVNVTATGGGKSHTTASSFTLDFGLVPVCTGTFSGVVRDAATGQPLTDALVDGAAVDAEGRYVRAGLVLGPNNEPLLRSLEATASGYHDKFQSELAECGRITQVDFELVAFAFGSSTGRVVVGIPDPDNPAFGPVTPSDEPVEGARVKIFNGEDTTGADGHYFIDDILLLSDNAPRSTQANVTKAGFWTAVGPRIAYGPDETVLTDFAIVPQCRVDVRLAFTFDDGEPAANVPLQFRNGSFRRFPITDENGVVEMEPQLLGRNNAPVVFRVVVDSSDAYEGLDVELLAPGCDHPVDAAYTLARRTQLRGGVHGTLRDSDSGAPVPGTGVQVRIGINTDIQTTTTDQNGEYALENLLIGFNAEPEDATVFAFENEEYWASQVVTVPTQVNASVRADLEALRKRFGSLLATAHDAASGEPIEGTFVTANLISFPNGLTDANGVYEAGGVPLAYLNAPQSYGLDFEASGYWEIEDVIVNFQADQTSEVHVEMIPICDGASVLGSVANAITGDPIEDVLIRASGVRNRFVFTVSTFTDADGNYLLEDITVGNDNTPIVVSVQASKPGFVTQTKNATIFCGAFLTVEFGNEGETGAIEGTVSGSEGQPLTDVFIGSGFGGATTTDENGDYLLSDVPLGAGSADRSWSVTAAPEERDPQTKQVTAVANQTVRLDFEFADNRPPVADAGPDQNARPGSLVTLDGSDSFDPDGDMIDFSWSLENGSKPGESTLGDADLSGAETPMPQLTPDVEGTYEVELVVSDGSLSSPPDTVSIQAVDPNVPPNADAGADRSVFLGDLVALDGSSSDDPDDGPQPLAFSWRFSALPVESALSGGDIADATTASPSFVPDVAGRYVLELEVGDGEDSDADDVVIDVFVPNVPPNARAGDDRELLLGEAALLDGTTSDDPDQGPDPLGFSWRFVSVPETSALGNGDIAGDGTPTPGFVPDVAGDYLVELEVFDGAESDYDNVLVRVSELALPPGPVLDLAARAKPNEVVLTWAPLAGAVAYDVYRGLEAGGPYELVAAGHVTGNGLYADFGLGNGVTYHYVVRVLGPDGQESPDSNEASATPQQRER